MGFSSCLLVVFAAVLFVIDSDHCAVLLCWSLSFDDSMSSFPKRQRLQHPIHAQQMEGIWKLTTNALPYEVDDIRSKLDKRFSNNGSGSDDDDGNNETILLKLNPDGTFKQCDEGYREGRWVTGRWKLQVLAASKSGINENQNEIVTDNKNGCWLLQLAMNRQYFGPPYDVLLEATNSILEGTNGTTATTPSAILCDGDYKRHADERTGQQLNRNGGGFFHKQWQGVVRKGKFIRPSPGKHPFDMEPPNISELNGRDDEDVGPTRNKRDALVINTDILMNPEPLGEFSLEQALSATAIDRISHDSQEDDDDETFFVPPSSSDDGVLQ